MELNPKKENVTLFNRYPVAFAGAVFLIVASVFLGAYLLSNRERNADCKETISAAYKERDEAKTAERAAQDKLVQVLLSQSEQRQTEQKKIDSVINKIVGDKAKRILTNSNN